ncbi:hypothetical protein L9F63_019086 [Diploptera punctata]|uniref:Transmembrane protein 9 n=1 Tax=Diploptera punctata TaxID=6984 RepID=A0AAD7ZVF0_DIPPU|nr:hypothetical protein L9F63_019086 [Diploptera punctata]
MWMKQFACLTAVIVCFSVTAQAQSYEDVRCKCVCPNPSVVNGTQSNRKLYIGNVPPNKCNCDTVILPRVGDDIKGKEQEFCPRCECKYESRNTTIIKVVVIIVIWIISLLVIYMLFLICLDPLLNKRAKGSYQEHTNEEDEASTTVGGATSHAMGVRANVLNRVGHQQDKWKRQVREQRRNIYDRHTMLN